MTRVMVKVEGLEGPTVGEMMMNPPEETGVAEGDSEAVDKGGSAVVTARVMMIERVEGSVDVNEVEGEGAMVGVADDHLTTMVNQAVDGSKVAVVAKEMMEMGLMEAIKV